MKITLTRRPDDTLLVRLIGQTKKEKALLAELDHALDTGALFRGSSMWVAPGLRLADYIELSERKVR